MAGGGLASPSGSKQLILGGHSWFSSLANDPPLTPAQHVSNPVYCLSARLCHSMYFEWIVLHWIEYCIWCAQRTVRLGSLSTQSLCAENGLARCCGHAADQSVRIHVYRGRWSSFTLRWTAESRSSIPHTRANDWPWVRRWKRVDEGTKPLSSFGTFCALLFG